MRDLLQRYSVPFVLTQPSQSSREDAHLALLCHWHHHLKTFCGYTYRRLPDGTWQWIPPADRDIDLSPLRRAIREVRRC